MRRNKTFFPLKIILKPDMNTYIYHSSEKKRFEINFFVRQNASNFAILIEKENPPSFFRVLFRAT